MSAETEIQVRKGWFFWQALNPKEPLGTIDSHTVWRARTFEGVIAKAQRKMFPASKGEHEWQRVLLHGDTGCSVFGAIGVYRMSAEEEALLALETVVFGAVIDAIDTMLLQGTVQANGGFWVWQDDVEQVRAAIVAYRASTGSVTLGDSVSASTTPEFEIERLREQNDGLYAAVQMQSEALARLRNVAQETISEWLVNGFRGALANNLKVLAQELTALDAMEEK